MNYMCFCPLDMWFVINIGFIDEQCSVDVTNCFLIDIVVIYYSDSRICILVLHRVVYLIFSLLYEYLQYVYQSN